MAGGFWIFSNFYVHGLVTAMVTAVVTAMVTAMVTAVVTPTHFDFFLFI